MQQISDSWITLVERNGRTTGKFTHFPHLSTGVRVYRITIAVLKVNESLNVYGLKYLTDTAISNPAISPETDGGQIHLNAVIVL